MINVLFKTKNQGFAQILVVLILGIIGIVAYLTLKPQISNLYPSPTPTQIPDSTANLPRVESNDWKTYTNTEYNYEFKYPTSYSLIKENSNGVTFGFSLTPDAPIFPYLTVSTTNLTDLSSLKPCPTEDTQILCLDSGKKWGQEQDISNTTVGSHKAKSFYLFRFVPDEQNYHVIQLEAPQKLEFKMLISGGGIDQTFSQILSTFKFTN